MIGLTIVESAEIGIISRICGAWAQSMAVGQASCNWAPVIRGREGASVLRPGIEIGATACPHLPSAIGACGGVPWDAVLQQPDELVPRSH